MICGDRGEICGYVLRWGWVLVGKGREGIFWGVVDGGYRGMYICKYVLS